MGWSLTPRLAYTAGEILGADLRGVQIHCGPEADSLNRCIGSLACAQGIDVFFRRHVWDPDSGPGMKLLAHELVHVCQDLQGRVRTRLSESDDPALEREADALAQPVAALMRGECIGQDAIGALRDFRARPSLARPDGPGIIQRTAAALVAAAQIAPPGPPHDARNCHEALLGWLLAAENYHSPWKLMRYSMNTQVAPNTTGTWLTAYIYKFNGRVEQQHLAPGASPVFLPQAGDILFTIQGGVAMHSMVVVHSAPNNLRIRGFNNAGSFNYPGQNPPAPAGAYDNNDRNICDGNLWSGVNGFGANAGGAELRWVKYANAATNVRQALGHWTHAHMRTPGWQHTGAPPCPPSCPH